MTDDMKTPTPHQGYKTLLTKLKHRFAEDQKDRVFIEHEMRIARDVNPKVADLYQTWLSLIDHADPMLRDMEDCVYGKPPVTTISIGQQRLLFFLVGLTLTLAVFVAFS